MENPKRLTLIDGSGFLFRAYHALPPLTRKDGLPVGAVLGFINMIVKLTESMKTDYMAVIFDAGRKTFRNRLYSEYKAHRPPAPDDLIPQFPLVREATIALNIPSIELADYEADDLIAAYAKDARKKGMEVVIVSSDKDLMQLIDEHVKLYDGMKQKTIGHAQVLEKFGVGPDRVRDVLALIGDSSDNIPGVPGIGPKTAAELILQFGDLSTLLTRLDEIKQPKRRDALKENIEKAKLSYELVGLCEDCPMPVPLEELSVKAPDPETLVGFLRKMEFKSLAAKYEQRFHMQSFVMPVADTPALTPAFSAATPSAVAQRYELVTDEDSLARWCEQAKKVGKVAFDTETTSLDAMAAEIVGFSLCIEPGTACYVPLNHMVQGASSAAQSSLFESTEKTTLVRAPGQLSVQTAFHYLKPLLADPSILKIGHNLKYDMLVLHKYGIEVTPLEDTMLLSYVLDAGKHNHGMDELAERHLGYKTISFTDVTGTGKSKISFAEVSFDKALAYAAEDSDITLRLWQSFKPRLLAEKSVTLYETIERPLEPILTAMEARGIKVDPAQLTSLSNDFEIRMRALELDAYKLAGSEFNLGSPKQLGEILFDKLQLEGGKKSKTGSYSTSADILEELAEAGHELPRRILDWRQLSKLKSTYTDALKEQINPQTDRVHTCFAMAVTSTGRLSSSDPNLQNIPIRSEEGRKIRNAFIAEKGCKLISADYSQIELRLLAHIADIPSLKEAFHTGSDVHNITASQIFGVAPDQVNGDLRRKAKTINFGIIYGMSAHGLAVRLGISRSEAATYIEAYFKQYPGIQTYMEKTKEFARAHGYVVTLFGRRCHVPGINDKNGAMRAFSERAAINAPLQGTAADIIKRAMITVEHALTGTDARMLLQVHDELVIEALESEATEIANIVKIRMEGAAHLSVPLTVETGIGEHWGAAH